MSRYLPRRSGPAARAPSAITVLVSGVLLLAACTGTGGGQPPGGAASGAPGATVAAVDATASGGAGCGNPAGASVGAVGGAFASVLGAVLCGMPDVNPCALVKQEDVQALFSVPLGSTSPDHAGDCTWHLSDPSKGDGLDMVVEVGRGESALNDDMGLAGDVKSISGIGDHARWALIADHFPHLGAVKGNYTCELTIGGGNGQLSVPSTGKGVFAKIDDSALPGFMEHLGALCNDIFAALGA